MPREVPVSKVGPSGEICSPTVKPVEFFDVESDAIAFYKAMHGVGTDEDAISRLISTRSTDQLKQIRAAFEQKYNKSLIRQLKGELSGDYSRLVFACMVGPAYYHAHICYRTLNGTKPNMQVLTQILCTSTSAELKQIQEKYDKVLVDNGRESHSTTLAHDIASEINGPAKDYFLELLKCTRDLPSDKQMAVLHEEGAETLIDLQKAQDQANAITETMSGGIESNSVKLFSAILSSESVWQISAIHECLNKIHKLNTVDVIRTAVKGPLAYAFTTTVMSCLDRSMMFANILHDGFSGLDNNDETIIRVISSRACIDLNDIKRCFLSKYRSSLYKCISKETTGDYKALLLRLVGAF